MAAAGGVGVPGSVTTTIPALRVGRPRDGGGGVWDPPAESSIPYFLLGVRLCMIFVDDDDVTGVVVATCRCSQKE